MKETEQTLLNQIKDQVAKDVRRNSWNDLTYAHQVSMIDEIANRYATAKAQASCEATLKKAAENAKHIIVPPYTLDKSSITDPSNITIV